MCCRSRKGKIYAITSCISPFKVIVKINRKVDRPGALGNLTIRKLSATKLVYYSRAADEQSVNSELGSSQYSLP